MIEQNIASFDVSVAGAIILQKFKYRDNGTKNSFDLLFRHGLIFVAVLFHDIFE